jgi:tyrosinase
MRSFIFIVFFLFVTTSLMAQSIRKNHNEMTASEKSQLVAAFVALENDEVNDLAAFHSGFFGQIHFNLPDDPDDDIFFPWHRRQILELEQAMQDAVNSKISIPTWDWIEDDTHNTALGELWDPAFMGGFDIDGNANDWNLNRTFTGSRLPNSTEVNQVSAGHQDYIPRPLKDDYSEVVENQKVHTGGHTWVGGFMNSASSPRDPIFYLHHGMVDKLWQDWIEHHNYQQGDNMYVRTDMPRYDGNTSGIPSVDPDTLLDSNKLGVFYAESGLAELHDYTVTTSRPAVFYYQYTIEAKDNFIVPNNSETLLESVSEVILKPGFHAQSGSSFTAKIDTDNDITTTSRIPFNNIPRKPSKFLNYRIIEDVYSQEGIENFKNAAAKILVDPKRKDNLELEFKEPCNSCEIEIVNAQNISVLKQVLNQAKNIDINLSPLAKGTHYLRVRKNNDLIFNKELEKL